MVYNWVEVYKPIIWTLCSCLILTVMAGSDDCPQDCVCDNQTALCDYLISTPGRFPDHIVNITISKSTVDTLGPMELGQNVQHVFIQDTEITTLATNAFSHIHNLISLSFSVVEINVIEEQAFSSMSSIREIVFRRTNVDTIKAKAFSNISHVSNFFFIDCDILKIESSFFHSVQYVGYILFSQVVVKEMREGAFRNVRHIKRVHLEYCKFEVMKCNAVMELREATSKHRDSFSFINSTLGCNCSSIPLFRYIHAHPDSVSDTVLCFSAWRNLSGPILHVRDQYVQLCSGGQQDSCVEHHATGTPSTPTATSTFHENSATTAESHDVPTVGGGVMIDMSEEHKHSVTSGTFSAVVPSAAPTADVQNANSSTYIYTSMSNAIGQTATFNAVVQTVMTSDVEEQNSNFNSKATSSNKLRRSTVIISAFFCLHVFRLKI